ncbi:PH domain-containing protein [Pseudomonas sp. TH41]|uniref:PH domain-containing protein n=1 Tax=Pseudomonas sp. TH41 TaxID=2796405 RepID=UPI00313E9AFD
MIDFNNKGFFKLKQNEEYAERVSALLLEGEQVIDSYKSMRDGVVFTNKRIIAVNVQGLTGSKKDFMSLPYKNIIAYSVEESLPRWPSRAGSLPQLISNVHKTCVHLRSNVGASLLAMASTQFSDLSQIFLGICRRCVAF